ncbi:unnamed protein product [Rangifer tarandus platyrhynchus]|uniref:Uncharacterized protein n=1 Tax=Rangifer tarandus platyrhynchus TaxID=3082113 RepID=A0ABN8ZYZ3_RANTA|nr:unnamed protein product [Rangifer tarandus platyrhynchus]
MMRPRLRPLTSARRLEGGVARDVIGGRAPGSTSDSSPFSLKSQAEAEHVLESHRMFDDLWNVTALSVTRRTAVVGCEEALRCSR